MESDQFTQQDPQEQYSQPEMPEQEIPHPGLSQDMGEQPDYGEETYRGTGRLEGKKAIITGGDSGIGRAVALAFAREGADVAISYLEEEEPDAQQSAAAVEREGRQAVKLPGDITSEAHCQSIVAQTVEAFGRVDILVNNAAYQMSREGIESISAEELDRTFRTNIIAMFHLVKAALPHMQPGSAIVNSCSIQAYNPDPTLLDYAATKAAIVNFSKGLAQELIGRGIRVNTVAPGPVWTPLIPATMPAEKVKQFGADAPIGRAAQPAELAPAYVFLASQESSFIVGETLGVTGGTPLP